MVSVVRMDGGEGEGNVSIQSTVIPPRKKKRKKLFKKKKKSCKETQGFVGFFVFRPTLTNGLCLRLDSADLYKIRWIYLQEIALKAQQCLTHQMAYTS